MANPEHEAKLREGVKPWNQWREDNIGLAPDLQGVYLSGENLQGANLHNANLQESNLSTAYLQRANLRFANLEGAVIHVANLEGADLYSANLEGADLNSTHLEGANLSGAHLEGAILIAAHLDEAKLLGATLDRADTRASRNIRLDGTRIHHVRYDLRFDRFVERWWNPHFLQKPLAIPWIELRRAYTGPNFLFTLLLLIAFLLPYALRVAGWQALNLTRSIDRAAIEQEIDQIDGLVQRRTARVVVNTILGLVPCVEEECKERLILFLVLGGIQGGLQGLFLIGFNILLVTYNGLRLYVTQTVSLLREEEEQSGWSPKKKEVDRLIVLHIILKWFFFVAVASGIANTVTILFSKVPVPV